MTGLLDAGRAWVKLSSSHSLDQADPLADWAPEERVRRAIPVENPARLYRFSP